MSATRPSETTASACSLPDAFARQVALRADAIAVEAGERRLTYGQLDAHASRLARRLRDLGVAPGDVVGVMAERGPATIAGIVGALKAGAAYTPLDPESPRMRLRRQLDAVRASAVVTADHLADRLAGAPQAIVALDAALDALASEDPSPLASASGRGDLCAVLFTSGSTGAPKGVALEHGNVLNLLEGASMYAPLPDEGALHVCAPQFDVAAYEIWASLTRGARLVCHPPGRPDPRAVQRTIAEREIGWASVVTSAFHQLVESGPEALARLRMLLVGGEVMQPRYARRFRVACPATRLVNIYGPAETTMFSFAHEVGDECLRDEPIPVGRPVAGARATVLGEGGRPVAPGRRGELHVAGPGIARGYLHAPELTAERFADAASPEERSYRTGDVVSERADGSFLIHGRVDHQVKLRGYRVEPGEVEAQLTAHPSVRDAAAIVREEGPGRRRLVAFVVADGDGCDEPALREFLAERLPEYLVPGAIATLAALPATPNGKVDRRALAAWELPEAGGDGVREARAGDPRAGDRRSAAIAAVFAEVLGVEAVDPAADFVALGGDSLLAVQALGRLRERLGLELPLSAVFEARSAVALAELAAAAEPAPPLPPLRPRRHDGPVAATAGQAKALMTAELAGESLPYQSQAAHRILGPLDVGALERALSDLVARHELLRTTFPRVDGRWLQRVHEPWPVRLAVADLRAAPDRERALDALLAEQAGRRLEPERLPLVRWSLARLDEQEHALLVVEHHLVHDGVSTAVVLRELAALYRACLTGSPAPLPPLAAQYRDFAAWQEELVASERGRRTFAHWCERLSDAPAPPELPFDRPRPPRQTYRGGVVRAPLPPQLAERVRGCARECDATPFAVMLAAFAALLARHGDAGEVVVGTGLANRRTVASEELIGMVVNTVALRLDLGGEPAARDLVARAHAAVLEAQEHQDVPFERVVEHVAPARAANASPLYQSLFSFHDAPVATLGLGGGATLVPRDALPNGSAKSDLNVVVVHRRGRRPAAVDPETYARVAEDGMTVVWEYNRDLFDRATAERLCQRYLHLLDQLAADPDRPAAGLELVDAPERARLRALSGTAAPYERDATIAEVFSARAGETPDAPALTADGQTLSYASLERRANRLAHRLRALGVERGARVGACVERSLDLIVAFLAVAKAGGAYVPLDPLDPCERLRACAESLGVSLVLTHVRHRGRLPIEPRRIVCLDDELDLARERDDAPPVRVGPLDPAYVMFTSGSTGQPKGVEVPHRAVVRLVRSADYVRLGPEETLLALAPPAFDASTFEIWGALLNGGRLVVAPPGPLSPGELADLLAREHVSTLWLTAGLFHRVVDDRPDALRRLRHLLAGGDVLSADHVRRALAVIHRPPCSSTATARPRARPSRAPTAWCRATPSRSRCRSAARSPTRACTCSTPPAGRSRPGSRGSCGSAATGSRSDTRTTPR